MSDAGSAAGSEAGSGVRSDRCMDFERSEMLLENIARGGERFVNAQKAFGLKHAANLAAIKATRTAPKCDTTARLAAEKACTEAVRARQHAIRELHAAAESLGRRMGRLAIDVDDQDDWASMLNSVHTFGRYSELVNSELESEQSSCATSDEEAEEEQEVKNKPKSARERREQIVDELFPGPTALLRLVGKKELNKGAGKKGSRLAGNAPRTTSDEFSCTIASEEDFGEQMEVESVKYPWDVGSHRKTPRPRISEMLRARRWKPRPD